MQYILSFDYQILHFICEYIRNDFLNYIMLFITHLGDAGVFWIVIAILCIIKKETRIFGISMLASLGIGLLIGNIIMKPLIARDRPFLTYNELSNLIKQGGYSFPSGHALSSFAASVSFYMCAKYQKNMFPQIKRCRIRCIFGKLLIFMAVLVAFSRLYVCVHYPTDVICGAIIGVVIAIFVTKLLFKSHLKMFEIF